MRPVEKLHPKDTVTYRNSNDDEVSHTIQAEYSPYGTAKFPLMANIGNYCSYCEAPLRPSDAEVEHVHPKSQGGSPTAWDNLLLGCRECNSLKGTTVPGQDYHFPDINNTYMDFVYDRTGRVKVNLNIPQSSQAAAENLLDLVKLKRFPHVNPPSDCDFRWQHRVEVWNTAKIFLDKYNRGHSNEDEVIRLAKISGYWSIWFTVFQGKDAVLARLISDFPGTCTACFDAGNHYRPICRNAADPADPV